MVCKLSDICEFVKGKIAVANLTKTNYISTENMLQNRGGITDLVLLFDNGMRLLCYMFLDYFDMEFVEGKVQS